MKTKLLTLLTLLVCAVSGAWAASPVDPSASDFTSAKSFGETTLIWTTAYYNESTKNYEDGMPTWATGWVVTGKSSARTTLKSQTSAKKYYLTPGATSAADVKYTTGTVPTAATSILVKGNGDQKTLYFYVTNVTKVEAYLTGNGNYSGYGVKISVVGDNTKTSTVNLDESNLSVVAGVDGLTASNSYIIKVEGVNTSSDSYLYAIRFTAAPSAGPTLTGASSSPAADATSVALSGSGYLKFSKSLTSVTSAKITISPSSNGEALSSIAIDGTDNTKVNYSWSGLKKETQYTINIAADAVSDGTDGNAATSMKFTTIEKAASSFALTSSSEVEVAIDGTSNITTTGNAGTVTYESGNDAVASVNASGVITAVAGGKTTITVTDPGSDDVKSSVKTVTVLVPYPNPSAADTYVLNNTQYAFSNSDNTKYYFKNGFTISYASGYAYSYAALESNTGMKMNANTEYVINVPSTVTVKWAEIEARSNYTSTPDANWGVVFGTDYSATALPYSNEDPAFKDFVIASPSAGGTLAITPKGNQWQAIITLHTDTYHAKNTVSYDKGTGTGTMTGTEKREGDTFILPASTFTNPASKYFKGWLCSVDSKRYAAGDTYTMTNAATTFTAQYGVIDGTSMIKAVLQSNTSATITGSIGGTYSADSKVQARDNSKGGCKMGNDGAYICITLASGSFKEGDIIQVNIGTAGAGGTFAFYKESAGTNSILTTEDGPTVGLHSFVLPAAAEGETKFYLVRKSGSNFNPFVDYIEVYRPHIVTLNASGFATYSKDWDFKVQSGATMYKMALDITDPVNPTISGTAITEAPAGAGVLLKGTAGDKAYILNTSQISALAGNSLNGTTDADGNLADIDKSTNDYFVLSGDTFKKYTGVAFGANKAFFQTANGALAAARAFTITFDDEETTSIAGVEAKKFVEDNKFYNLNGQQVVQPTKGLYIVNGKKVVIK